jgi:hypothetical protein
MGKKSPKKVAKVSACPETIKKALTGTTNVDGQDEPVFKELSSGNVVMSKATFEVLQTPTVRKQLKAAFTADGDLSPDSAPNVEAARQRLTLKRDVKRQDERASKITSRLSTSNPVESARCLADIEKALAGGLTPDYSSMFEIARDRGNESVGHLVDDPTYAERDAAAWRSFAIQVMRKLHGGDNYLYRLGRTGEHMQCRQGDMTVGEYADKHGPSLTATLKAYDREGIEGREKTAVESSFTAQWIYGLNEDVQYDLLRKHTSSINQGKPMSFESVKEEALVNEDCRGRSNGRTSDGRNRNQEGRLTKRTASGAAATPLPHQIKTDKEAVIAPAMLDAINAADKKLSTTVAAMQAVLNKMPQSGSTPDMGKGDTDTTICFFCQRKGLEFNHNHLTCPVRLANKRARSEQPNPHFQRHTQLQQPPPGPPLMPPPPHLLNPAHGARGVCYRCGQPGHRAFECSGPCKTCRQVGKGQHLPNCSNKPKPFSGNGGGGRR